MLGAAWCVMNMQHSLGHLAVPRLAQGAMLTGLVARYSIVVRDLVTLLTQRCLVISAELTAIGGVGGQDVVVGVQHDCWQGIVLKVGNQS
ncbi:hypothetical protein D3C80_1150500 [compost metagenome]